MTGWNEKEKTTLAHILPIKAPGKEEKKLWSLNSDTIWEGG